MQPSKNNNISFVFFLDFVIALSDYGSFKNQGKQSQKWKQKRHTYTHTHTQTRKHPNKHTANTHRNLANDYVLHGCQILLALTNGQFCALAFRWMPKLVKNHEIEIAGTILV